MSNKEYRFSAMKAATDLHYGETVIQLIRNAKSDIEIERIMCTAREQKIVPRKIIQRKEPVSWFQSIFS